ncbi:MAG: 1,2-dihydroxy-3-keto-5-methylthiopentene dioxygenase [Sulfuricaulis sp.]
MARIISPDGKELIDPTAIQNRLARLGITLRHWPAPSGRRAKELLEQPGLNDAEKAELLGQVQHRFDELKREKGYSTHDLVVIHENIPGLAEMLGKFDKIHYHTDDEVRYILAGCGYFGFVEPDQTQFLLEVTAGDYINVPANTEHWFEMKEARRIKAVRYFIDTSGWTPVYTQRQMAFV